MADEEISLSIEETNKLRISLGLKPLSVDNEPKKASAEDNYAKYKDDLKKTEEAKKIQEKIQRSRNKRELKKKLSGKGLSELGEDEDDDALAWIKRQKKRQKELAELKQKELEAMDNEVIEEYKSENLKGLKVGHDISEIEAGEEEILVLKDAMITEDDDVNDELISNRLTEKEKLQKNLELKKKRNVYGGVYDDEEALFGKKKILSQYDDDDDENKGFILNGKGEVFDTSIHRNDDQNGLKKGGLDLNYNKMQEIKDYYTKDEMVSFKKPKKKKKKKHSRKKLEDINDDLMDIDNGENTMESSSQSEIKPVEKYSYSNITTNIDDINFIDDDELQIALSKARRKKTKKLVKSLKETVEDVKQENLKEKEKEENDNEIENENDLSYDLRRKEETEGVKFINEVSETSEFIRNIPTLPLLQRQNQNEKSSHTNNNDLIEKENEMELESLHDSNNEDDIQEQKEESLEEGEKMESEHGEDTNEQSTTSNTGIAALEEEPLISSGMAATVSLLLQKGIVNPVTKEELEKEKLQLEKEKWLNEQKINDLIKERRKQKDRDRRDRHGRSSRDRDRDRDYDREDIYRERERAREAEKKFKNYKPVVNIEYHDEFGRTLTQKEAFRQLSHKFHGKTSGKLKTEKRLKKLEEELKLKQMSSTDTPLGTVSALQEKTKAMGSAHLVLSIGNRGVLPSDNDIANLQPRTDVKKKSKETNSNESLGTSSTQQSSFVTSLNNPGNTNAPKREKITFGLKRKAEQEINPVFKKRE